MTTSVTPYVTLEEAAAHFKVSISTFRSWLRRDIIPKKTYIQVNSVYRFDLGSVEAALKERCSDNDTGNDND